MIRLRLLTLLMFIGCGTRNPTIGGSLPLACPGCIAPTESDYRARQQALTDKGEDYVPRTEHLTDSGEPHYTNRLIFQSSPYLLQHAHNPVNWFSWGDEAFDKARAEGKPVLLSVGYATCHWCHVMERESFEDLEIAQFINENYIAIKVDREVRPDVDEIYMTAVRMMIGRGGWPMTVIMTPDGEPFFGGTYLPPRDTLTSGRRGFLTVLKEMSDRYQNDPADLLSNAVSISRRIVNASKPRPSKNLPVHNVVEHNVAQLLKSFDPRWGGWGGAPKFPAATKLELLMRFESRNPHSDTRAMITTTLDRMARGGIYDQIGGGFHRYATDTTWLVPHFEKMLYDNAQLATTYANAWQLTKDPLYHRIATETLDYLLREMTAADGTFYSATDADSFAPNGEREEGWFFTWTEDELAAILNDDAFGVVTDAFKTSSSGNFEGRVILTRPMNDSVLASRLELSLKEMRATLNQARTRLYNERLKRPAPLRDDKRLTAWNGLALTALAHGVRHLGNDDYETAMHTLAAALIQRGTHPDKRLVRTNKNIPTPAFLDDYTFLIQGLLDAFEASGHPQYLTAAIDLQTEQDRHFTDPEGGYFYTANDHEKLIARTRPEWDGAIPSGNSVATMNLLRLAEITQRAAYREHAEATLKAHASRLHRGGTSVPKLLSALDFAHSSPLEIVILHSDDSPKTAFMETLKGIVLPSAVILPIHTRDQMSIAKHSPLVSDKTLMNNRATAYVCQGGVCQAPTTDPTEFATQLIQMRQTTDE